MKRIFRSALGLVVLHFAGAGYAADEFSGREKLRAQSQEFRPEVLKITDRVYVAVGFCASNVVLIRGETGVVIVDTGTDMAAARAIRTAFGDLIRGPVRAVIYTHSHPDHTGGARVFAGDDKPDIIAHGPFPGSAPDIGRANRDGGDQFGMSLPESLFINAGVQQEFGRRVRPTREGYLPPTRPFTGEELDYDAGGLKLRLLHGPGESTDNIFVWLPDIRVLITGDNFLRSFPNVAPIRGARMRSPESWISSLDQAISLQPWHLIPGHTRPVSGEGVATAALISYRDGIKSILDQSLEGMNRGERPDELVAHIRLPAHLAESPFLQEFYGSVEWMVRGIYADRLGWFDGNATNLFPLAQRERAANLVELLGGPGAVLAKAEAAMLARDFKWAAELADYVLIDDGANHAAKKVKARALIELGERQVNAIARNYYLTTAMVLLRDAAEK